MLSADRVAITTEEFLTTLRAGRSSPPDRQAFFNRWVAGNREDVSQRTADSVHV
ncbi:hypothetical protein [Dyadobacter sp. CY351]|uniref:hypothetical protein n=1 Tax=Dyadobacter sp. CY351 TaxID=2909337 RepID=UPI001F4754F9|nr:hypothetical protein [Dyadobacter sp. CY351]MCF2517743.1 hypothetical protein [Dyadobacter sp. CY351]